MIMLQPCLFYFLLKIGIVSQIKNRNATFFSYCPEFISIEHSYRFIAWSNTKATIIVHTCAPTNTFFSGNFNNTRCSARTILRCFRSIFQDNKTFNIRRIDRHKHTQITKNTVYNNQRIIASSQWSGTTQADSIQCCRSVGTFQNSQTRYPSADCIQWIGYLVFIHLVFGDSFYKSWKVLAKACGISNSRYRVREANVKFFLCNGLKARDSQKQREIEKVPYSLHSINI